MNKNWRKPSSNDKGKEGSKIYGSNPQFKTMSDADDTLTNPDKPKAKSKW